MAPGEYRELVQIGAVKLDIASLEERDSFEVLVRPRINPVLSPYIEALTGISNEALRARGVDFVPAYERFAAFCAGAPRASFGRDDHIFEECIRLYGIQDLVPLSPFVNATTTLKEAGIAYLGFHACDVARLCGAPFEGRAHDGLADARSVALGLRSLVRRGVPNPFREFLQ
jgi:inhibitor of KinA sporulation pathway (predicted exonuclease)